MATSLFWGTARSSVWCPVLMSVGREESSGALWGPVGSQEAGSMVLAVTLLRRGSLPRR